MIFELHGQFIDNRVSVRAEPVRSDILLTTGVGLQRAPSLSTAIRLACAQVGPLMERGDRAGGGWGLLVAAGPVSVAYGNWPAGAPREPGFEFELLRRILAEYRPGDGARAALQNATKVIDAYAERGQRQLGRAA